MTTEDSPTSTARIPPELSGEIRRLMHDLSNALEIVLQVSYLLTTADTAEPAKEWIGLLDRERSRPWESIVNCGITFACTAKLASGRTGFPIGAWQ